MTALSCTCGQITSLTRNTRMCSALALKEQQFMPDCGLLHKKLKRLLAGIVTALLLCLPESAVASGQKSSCRRIITLAPSATEVVYSLGLGANLVGVSRYDSYPDGVKDLPRVGGLLDPARELIITLKPDLIITAASVGTPPDNLATLSAQQLNFNHNSLSGILESITLLGNVCNKKRRAARLINDLKKQISAVQQRLKGVSAVSALIVIGSEPAAGLRGLYISGKDGFYNDLVRIAGGVNAYRGSTAALPSLSAEGLIALKPEVILQIVPETLRKNFNTALALKFWKKYSMVPAVKSGRIYFLKKSYVYVPGPRFTMLLNDIAHYLHPEVFKNS
ncbi:MAG: ABC transporter substrate-binding protein [Candidatus Dadabacteria bacterium]|nr:MAG: ABC transporter substrate-binding protein [Candidatus Dadabacteria bacterium]